MTFQILDQPGNSTAPLLSISDLASLGAILDLQRSTISIRGKPPVRVPTTSTGLIIIPVTKDAVDRWSFTLKHDPAKGDSAYVGEPIAMYAEPEKDTQLGVDQSTTFGDPANVGDPQREKKRVTILEPTLGMPLTRVQRDVLKKHIGDHKQSQVSALLSLLHHKSKIDCLTCPIVWKSKSGTEQLTYEEATSLVAMHKTRLFEIAETQRPARFLAYCSRTEIDHYRLFVKVAMLQASAKRKFYVWSSFDPHTLNGDLAVNSMVDYFKLYTRQA